MEQWNEFIAYCQENAPQYAWWISQYLSRHTQQGKSIAWMKENIIKLLNTSDAMSGWLADQVGEKEEEQARIERDKIRTRLSEVA